MSSAWPHSAQFSAAQFPAPRILHTIAVVAAATATLLGATDAASARRSSSSSKAAAHKPVPPKGPLTLVVSLRKQRVTVYGPEGKITEAPVSTGRSGHDTPTGVFSVIGKEVMHHSNLYGDAPMPFMNRITWSGVALHAGALPGYPASHGCIRLPYGFARTLYGMTRMGTRVIVARDDVEPEPILHPLLFKPLPSENGASLVTAATVATSLVSASNAAGVVSALIGITPAAAAEEHPAGERSRRTREMAATERAAEMNRITERIQALEAQKTEREAKSRDAAQAVIEARLAQRNLRIEAARLAHDLKKLDSDLNAANRDFARLGRASVTADSETALARAEQKEDQLESRASEIAAARERTQAELKAAEARAAGSEAAVNQAENGRAAAFEELRATRDELRQAQAAKTAAEKLAANRAKPITVLISRKTGKLYVRQGFDDVLETAVTIADPERPFGTHVYTAVAYTEGEKALRWNVVTAAGEPRKPREERTRHKHKTKTAARLETGSLPASSPGEALGRIAIPDAAQESIAELIKPGSTLMISDYGISHETGKYTDYILLTR